MTQLQVALTLPGLKKGERSKTLSIKGVVVRKDKEVAGKSFLMAIYFSEIKPSDRETLQKFIESRLPASA